MGFYEELSRYYDELFPVGQSDMAFFNAALGDASRVLDIGCGTGNKTMLLAGPGRSVVGIDSDAGMIAKAQETNAAPGVSYEVLDMRGLTERFAPVSFDGVVCLGNTLVHLDGPEAVGGTLRAVAALLAPGGVLALQILNYDRILDQGMRSLPPLESAHARFERFYEPEGTRLHFITRLAVTESGAIFDSDELLYPLRRAELDGILADSGFEGAAWYGGFQGEAYDETSLPAIIICRRV